MQRWERLTKQGYVRFYQAFVTRDLLGDWTLVTVWGRKNAALGGMRISYQKSERAARTQLRQIARDREKHGYVLLPASQQLH